MNTPELFQLYTEPTDTSKSISTTFMSLFSVDLNEVAQSHWSCDKSTWLNLVMAQRCEVKAWWYLFVTVLLSASLRCGYITGTNRLYRLPQYLWPSSHIFHRPLHPWTADKLPIASSSNQQSACASFPPTPSLLSSTLPWKYATMVSIWKSIGLLVVMATHAQVRPHYPALGPLTAQYLGEAAGEAQK